MCITHKNTAEPHLVVLPPRAERTALTHAPQARDVQRIPRQTTLAGCAQKPNAN